MVLFLFILSLFLFFFVTTIHAKNLEFENSVDLLEWLDTKIQESQDEKIIFTALEYNNLIDKTQQCIIDENEEQKLCLNFEHAGDIFVVGDLHGSLPDALFIAEQVKNSEDNSLFVFLGDYTDRGDNGPAVLALVLSLRCKYPQKVILLRGNHENIRLNRRYGFAEQMDEISDGLIEKIGESIYKYLPQCALINDIFFVHGGPPFGEFESKEDLLNMNIDYNSKKHSGLLWSDPRQDVSGIIPSKRGAGFYYGPDILDDWCNKYGVRMVFRGHEVVKDGFRVDFNGSTQCKHYTVFSSLSQKGTGACAIIRSGVVYVIKIQGINITNDL